MGSGRQNLAAEAGMPVEDGKAAIKRSTRHLRSGCESSLSTATHRNERSVRGLSSKQTKKANHGEKSDRQKESEKARERKAKGREGRAMAPAAGWLVDDYDDTVGAKGGEEADNVGMMDPLVQVPLLGGVAPGGEGMKNDSKPCLAGRNEKTEGKVQVTCPAKKK